MRGPTLQRLPLFIAAVVIGVTVILFIVAGILTKFSNALNILEVNKSPYGHDEGVTIPLSIFGYVLVPAVIGLAVTSAMQVFIGRRLATRDELDRIAERVTAERQPERADADKTAG